MGFCLIFCTKGKCVSLYVLGLEIILFSSCLADMPNPPMRQNAAGHASLQDLGELHLIKLRLFVVSAFCCFLLMWDH